MEQRFDGNFHRRSVIRKFALKHELIHIVFGMAGNPELSLTLRRTEHRDLGGVRALYQSTRNRVKTDEEFDWLYFKNPAGPHQSWVAIDNASSLVVSGRPLFPWRVCVHGTIHTITQGGDASTHPDFQRRGIFSRLTAEAWRFHHKNGSPLTYCFPNKKALDAHRKISPSLGTDTGHRLFFQLRRWVRPISPRSKTGSALLNPADTLKLHAKKALARLLDFKLPRPSKDIQVETVKECDGRFDKLWHRNSALFEVACVRDSAFVKWRFFDAPGSRHEVYAAIDRDGEYCGYAVTESGKDNLGNSIVYLVEIFAEPGSAEWWTLLLKILDISAEKGVSKIETHSHVCESRSALLRTAGFIPRKDVAECVVHVHRSEPWIPEMLSAKKTFFTYGDADFIHSTF